MRKDNEPKFQFKDSGLDLMPFTLINQLDLLSWPLLF